MPFSRSKAHEKKRLELTNNLVRELQEKRIGPPGAQFVPKSAVRDVLNDDKIHELFKKLDWYTKAKADYICQHCRCIIATFVAAGWTSWEDLPKFVRFSDTPFGFTEWTDRDLPLDSNVLGDLDIRTNRGLRRISLYQHDYAPAELHEDSHARFSGDRRLPYEDVRKRLGSGAYGMVYKVTIIPGYLFAANDEGFAKPTVRTLSPSYKKSH